MREMVLHLVSVMDSRHLIKLGLVPNGKITGQDAQSPTLTFNTINRHISKMVYTKVVSNLSPWLA